MSDPSAVDIVRRRLADGRTIADSDVHRLVAEIDRLNAIIQTRTDALMGRLAGLNGLCVCGRSAVCRCQSTQS